MTRRTSTITVTDMFCGAGGSSQGAAQSGADIRLALNHWKLAIETHAANFREAAHDVADVSGTDPRRYAPTTILLASPECTNHSLAKGQRRKALGQRDFFTPRDFDPAAVRSRATMWDVWRFAEIHRYEAIIVENVVDARYWELWDAWWRAGELLGYRGQCVYLNSMFCHPTPQSRDRMYVVWTRAGRRRPDLRITPPAWCARCARDVDAVQAWKPGRSWGRYGSKRQYEYCCPTCAGVVTPYYYAALNAIDWSLPAERIGDRKRALRPRTMERIRFGLERYGRTPLVVRTNMTSGTGCRVRRAVAQPLDTQPGSNITALVAPAVLMAYRIAGERDYALRGLDAALPTTVTSAQERVILPPSFLINTRHQRDDACRVRSAEAPLATQTGSHDFAVVGPAFLTPAGSQDAAPRSVDARAPTMTTSDRCALVSEGALMSLRDAGRFVYAAPSDPVHTQVASASQTAIISRTPFLVSYYGTARAESAAGAVRTISTVDRHALIDVATATPALEDCHFRMLAPHEVGRAMAFGSEYIVLGTARDKVRQYGNAVTPPAMRLLTERVIQFLTGDRWERAA